MVYCDHMKTTFDIADNILTQSRAISRRDRVSLKDMVEEGLLLVIDRHERGVSFEAKPVTFGGNGLRSELADKGWGAIRDAVYEGHGS